MKKDIPVRVPRDLFFLIKAIKLLMANEYGEDATYSEAGQKLCDLFFDFAVWDTKGHKVIDEFKKVKKNSLRKLQNLKK